MGGGGGLPTAGRASYPGNLGWPGDSDGRGPLLAEADEPGLTLADAERPSSQPDNTGEEPTRQHGAGRALLGFNGPGEVGPCAHPCQCPVGPSVIQTVPEPVPAWT